MQKKITKQTIAHYIPDYLNLSEPWIFHQITSQTQFNSIVLCRNIKNRDTFPFRQIYKYPLLSDHIKVNSPVKLVARKTLSLAQRIIDNNSNSENDFYKKIITTKNAKLVHAHFGTAGYQASKLKLTTKLPLVVSFYGSDAYWLPKQHPSWTVKYQHLFKFANAFIVRGPTMKKQLQKLGCPSSKIYYIDYGVDLKKIPFTPPKPTTNTKFLIACRLEPIKAVNYSITAFAQVAKSYPDASLTIFGQGSQEHYLKKLVINNHIPNISFQPFLPHNQLLNVVKNFHIFLHPSITTPPKIVEGNPTSLIERVAAGLPTISTNHADIPLIIVHNKNGLLVPEKNIKKLANAMVYLIENQHLWSKFALWGRRHVEKNFNLETQTHVRENLYQKLINQ